MFNIDDLQIEDLIDHILDILLEDEDETLKLLIVTRDTAQSTRMYNEFGYLDGIVRKFENLPALFVKALNEAQYIFIEKELFDVFRKTLKINRLITENNWMRVEDMEVTR